MSAARARCAGKFHALRVSEVARLCDDATAIEFDVPSDLEEAFRFSPGQSLTLRRRVDGSEERRTYSICSPAGTAPRIGVREIPGGLFSAWLVHQVRVGDEVDVHAPTGRFVAEPTAGGRHLCIAAGSGITPLLSIASSLLAHSHAEVTLLYGNRTSASVMFAEELGDLKNRYGPRFQVVHVLSREPRSIDLLAGRLDEGRLSRIFDQMVPADRFDQAWLCGPLGMITGAKTVLTGLGLPEDRMHTELFYVDEPPPQVSREATVPGGATTEVTVVLDGNAATYALSQDRTVLDGAQAMRADLPFACRGGVCGTCRAKVTQGVVDLRRNYALEPAEVAAGFVVTCQAFPRGRRVTVDFDA